jgi:Cft2 family RNA processing exonuclease
MWLAFLVLSTYPATTYFKIKPIFCILMIQFFPLGGAGEIGANCYYLNINGTGVILDCGMHPQKKGLDSLPDFNLLEDKPLDHILITHAHQDHLNSLPFLIKKFPYLKITTTPQTRALSGLTLHNAISILRKQVNDESFEIYSHEEVDLLIKSIDYKSYEEEFYIKGFNNQDDEPVTVKFYDAGHILGSAGILLNYKGYKIFYTGDINISSQTLLPGAQFPKEKINTLICETTYGATDSKKIKTWGDETEHFTQSLNKVINAGGSVLIPVFSLGKMQEIFATILLLMKKTKVTSVDIYTGGIGKKVTRAYDYNRFVVNYNQSELVLHDFPQKDIRDVNNFDEFFKFPSIVLASSGMIIESTASYNLAKRWFRQKNSAIFTVGYMDENTPGYKIAKANKGSNLQLCETDKKIEVRCDIKNFSFSAHSRREELISIIEKLKPGNVILVHGNEKAIDWMGNAILKKYKGIKVYAASPGEKILFD